MRFRESMRTLGLAVTDHPWVVAVIGACTTAIIITTLGAVLWFQHVERENRQLWIETNFETRIDANNKLLAQIETELRELDVHGERIEEILRLCKGALEFNQAEMRQLRIAVLESMKATGKE